MKNKKKNSLKPSSNLNLYRSTLPAISKHAIIKRRRWKEGCGRYFTDVAASRQTEPSPWKHCEGFFSSVPSLLRGRRREGCCVSICVRNNITRWPVSCERAACTGPRFAIVPGHRKIPAGPRRTQCVCSAARWGAKCVLWGGDAIPLRRSLTWNSSRSWEELLWESTRSSSL